MALAAEKGKLVFVRGGNIWIAGSDGSGARQLTHSRKDRARPCLRWGLGGLSLRGGRRLRLRADLPDPRQGGVIQQFRHPELQGGEHPASRRTARAALRGPVGTEGQKGTGLGDELCHHVLSLADLGRGTVRRIVSSPNTMLDAGIYLQQPGFLTRRRLIAYQQSGSDVSGGFAVLNLQGKKVFAFPKNPRDATPCWRPQFARMAKRCFVYSTGHRA